MKHMKLFISLSLIGIASSGFAGDIENGLSGVIDIIVSQDGSGDYVTVNEAIMSVPDNSTEETVIFLRKGIYFEKVIIPYQKMNITLVGEDVDSTVIRYNDSPETTSGNTFGTHTFCVNADNFSAMNVTFENNAGDVGQALAFSSYGDKHQFYHCRFLGWQDTYFINYRLRNYMKDCFIEGAVDYIYGYGIGVYDSCQVHTVRAGGVITAASTSTYNSFGLTFRGCRLTTSAGVNSFYLGRPWQGKPHVAYLNTFEPESLSSRAWTNMNSGLEPIFAEYNCFGDGFQPDKRSTKEDYPGIQLTEEQAAPYMSLENIFAAASFASQEEDLNEIYEMRKPFDDANLTDLILEVMYRGRDTFPDIPVDDWVPEFNNDVFSVVDKYTIPFMDSLNMNGNITEIKYADDQTLELTPGMVNYHIELDPSTTEAPEFDVYTENPLAMVEIEYPESIPGYTSILVTGYDKSSFSEVSVYNSVNNAWSNAYLDSIVIKNIKVDNFDPGVFEYDFQLPKGSSRYFSTKMYKAVKDATTKLTKPSSLPGQLIIDVTAVDGETKNQYVINVTVSTAIDEINADNLHIYSVDKTLHLNAYSKSEQSIVLKLFNLNGQEVLLEHIYLKGGENMRTLSANLESGIYLYSLKGDQGELTGKVAIE